jgi:hemolysin activation/secretion protein
MTWEPHRSAGPTPRRRWCRGVRVSFAAALLLGSAASGAQAPEAAAPQRPAAAGQEVRFDLLEFRIEGNTVLGVPQIEQVVTPFLGPGRTMSDVESARSALEKAYQGAGWLTVFVDVPEQRVDGGVVTLQVLQGRVDRLRVTGARYFSQGHIRRKVAELQEGRVPNFNEVQRQLALVNRGDERRVQPVLRPGRLPGTVEIELKVTDELPLQSTVELNNQHSADTDALRLSASLNYANLFQRDHGISLTATVSPREPRQTQALVANYSVPRDSGSTWVGYLAASDSTVETLGGVTVLGDGVTLGVRHVRPFAGPGGSYHSLSLGGDYKDLSERVAFADSTVTSTPLRYLPLQAAYNGTWSGGGRQTQAAATLTAAMRRLLERQVACPLADGSVATVDQFACKRRNATGSFAALRLDLRHSRPLAGGVATLRLAGQATTHLLPSGEQFSLGGVDTVRGYYEGESVGDTGVLGSVELRSSNLAPRLVAAADLKDSWLSDLSVAGFLDVGRATVLEPLPEQAARVPLLGSGVGLRLNARGGVTAALDLAVAHKATRSTASGARQAHFKLGLKF